MEKENVLNADESNLEDSEMIERLNSAFETPNSFLFEFHHLLKIAEQVEGFLAAEPGFTTNDGYSWFGKVRFQVAKGEITVFFPYAKSGKIDRSIKLSINGSATEEELAKIFNKLIEFFKRMARKYTGRTEDDY